MDYLPIGLRIAGRTCLLVGGGETALRKAELLSRAGALLRVVAESCLPALAARPRVEWRARRYTSVDLDAVVAVVVADEDAELRRQVAADAGARHIPVNVVDVPELCTFVMPALVDRKPIVVSILSAGAAPVLARRLRGEIEALLPGRLGALAGLLQSFRPEIKRRLPDLAQRRAFFERVLDGPIPQLVYRHQMDVAEQRLKDALDDGDLPKGMAFMIGVGPGDPELLTLQAQRMMQQADRVLHDVAVPAGILERCRRDALLEVCNVSIAPEAPETQTAGWVERLVTQVRAGERVAVLVCGAQADADGVASRACAAAGVGYVLVPGVATVPKSAPSGP